jgi:hypothetical protein
MRKVAGIGRGIGYIVLKNQMQKLIYALWVGIILIMRPMTVNACSCVRGSILNQVNNSRCVFKGTVVSRYPTWVKQFGEENEGETVRFRVERFYRGRLEKQFLEVGVVYGGSSCGYNFENGKTYLVFAEPRPVPFILTTPVTYPFSTYSHDTNLCSGNRLYTRVVEAEILLATKHPFIWR